MTTTKERVRQILNDCCAGNAKLATDILHEEFIIIDRCELPDVFKSEHGNGWCTALAQESYQPSLTRDDASERSAGEWSRKIAYANLAVAEAVEAAARVEAAELQEEAFKLYTVYCKNRGLVPVHDWDALNAGSNIATAYLELARTARQMHGKA